jgi:hypothetical protein
MQRRNFTREFKLEAVKLIRDRGVSYAQDRKTWAPSLLAENKCIPCLHALIACNIRQEPPNSQRDDAQYAVYSKACLAALADCMASCSKETAPTSGTPN